MIYVDVNETNCIYSDQIKCDARDCTHCKSNPFNIVQATEPIERISKPHQISIEEILYGNSKT